MLDSEMSDVMMFWKCFTVRRERKEKRSLMTERGERQVVVGRHGGIRGEEALNINFK